MKKYIIIINCLLLLTGCNSVNNNSNLNNKNKQANTNKTSNTNLNNKTVESENVNSPENELIACSEYLDYQEENYTIEQCITADINTDDDDTNEVIILQTNDENVIINVIANNVEIKKLDKDHYLDYLESDEDGIKDVKINIENDYLVESFTTYYKGNPNDYPAPRNVKIIYNLKDEELLVDKVVGEIL